MHSSRMRIGRSLTVCRGLLLRGGRGGGAGERSTPGGVWQRGEGGVCQRGGMPGGCQRGVPEGWCARGGGIPACTEADTPPPVNRMTNSSKNITLATTSLRPVINRSWQVVLF